jgi:hypothetical protein
MSFEVKAVLFGVVATLLIAFAFFAAHRRVPGLKRVSVNAGEQVIGRFASPGCGCRSRTSLAPKSVPRNGRSF